MSHNIRPADPSDLASVERIVHAAYTQYEARIGRKPGPMLDNYRSLIDAGYVHVIEHEGAVHGIVVLIPEDGVMLLDNVAVSPEAQGKGLGRKLLAFAERAAIEAGKRSVRLYTNEAMTENITLYARTGYAETHRAEEKGFRRVYMTKSLP